MATVQHAGTWSSDAVRAQGHGTRARGGRFVTPSSTRHSRSTSSRSASYAFSYGPFVPKGSLIWAVVLSGAYLVFQGITYASLIAAMPRAGGDYVWKSRVLGGGIGFVLAVAGWWFILWHWVPIYANILATWCSARWRRSRAGTAA